MVQQANRQATPGHANGPTAGGSASAFRTPASLGAENRQFANTPGLSQNNASHNFQPAFRNEETGEVALAKFADGRQAPMHVLLGLPDSWATARNARGQIAAVANCVVAGFVRDGQFYTRAEAAAAVE